MTSSPNALATTCQLTVNITGLKSQDGQLCFSIFSSAAGFPDASHAALDRRHISASEPTLTFNDLPLGTYAIAVFHDANNDGILNRNLLGIPKEGFGFSNNPKIFMGPPSFQDAALTLSEGTCAIEIHLKHFDFEF